MKTVWIIPLLLFLVLSCRGTGDTILLTPSSTATRQSTEMASSPTPLIPPQSSTPRLPTDVLQFFRLRLEYSTSSDWSTLDFLNPGTVLTSRLVTTTGQPNMLAVGISRMALNQPLSAAEANSRVGMTVDFALSSAAQQEPLQFVLRKGDLHGSMVRFYAISGSESILIKEVLHDKTTSKEPGFNPLEFELDFSSVDVPIISRQTPDPNLEKLLLAFFYPWYSLSDWRHDKLKDLPVEPYASGDYQVIVRQVEQARSAGIDGFISSWWGPGSDTDRNLKRLLEIASQNNFKVSIYFETLQEDGPRPLEEITEWLDYAITTYGEHPAWIKVDGKPLIVLWASNTLSNGDWQVVLDALQARGVRAVYLGMGYDLTNLQIFSGLHEYGVFTIPNLPEVAVQIGQAVHNYSLLDENQPAKIWAATVQPGYDETLIPGRTGLVQERFNGDFYRMTFEAALASDPDWVFITSWNEWWEHTHIEPGQLYGDQYLQITKEYAERWKGK